MIKRRSGSSEGQIEQERRNDFNLKIYYFLRPSTPSKTSLTGSVSMYAVVLRTIKFNTHRLRTCISLSKIV